VVDCGGIDICKHRYIPILLNGWFYKMFYHPSNKRRCTYFIWLIERVRDFLKCYLVSGIGQHSQSMLWIKDHQITNAIASGDVTVRYD
jgi:hypothetical protein